MGCASSVSVEHQGVVKVSTVQTRFPTTTVMSSASAYRTEQKVTVTKEIIITYLKASHQAEHLEFKNIEIRLARIEKKKVHLQKKLELLNERYHNLETKEKKSLDLTSAEFVEKSGLEITDEEAEKIKEEYGAAKVEKKMNDIQDSMKEIKEKLVKAEELQKKLSADQKELEELHTRQDLILEQIFGGIYGSDLEDQIESYLDKVFKKQISLQATYQNWKISENIAGTAANQLDQACRIWYHDVMPTVHGGQYAKIFSAHNSILTVRARLQAAFNNLKAVKQRVFPQVAHLPYFTNVKPNAFLQNNFSAVFVDPFMPYSAFGQLYNQRQIYDQYHFMYQASLQLTNYLKQVTESSISKEIQKVSDVVKSCRHDLRKERIRLMKDVAKEHSVDLDEIIDTESDDLDAVDDILKEEEEFLDFADEADEKDVDDSENVLVDIEKTKNFVEEKSEDAEETVKEDEAAKASETAEAPTRNELFGDLDTLMEEYHQRTKQFELEQESARAKGDAQLKERLKRRRSRKMREAQKLEGVSSGV